MQRVRAIFVIVALLAAPLALLARSFAAAADGCNGYCCLPHRTHNHHSHGPARDLTAEGMKCHHDDADQAMNCAMRNGHSGADLGVLAPLAPTTPSQVQRVNAPPSSRHPFSVSKTMVSVGVASAPFEPPRA